MKKLYIFIFVIVGFSLFFFKTMKKDTEKVSTDVIKIYANTCASCHGNSLQRFKVLKSYNKSTIYLSNAISEGKLELGMPPFKTMFSSEEISQLANYIKTFDYTKNHITSSKQSKKYSVIEIASGLEIPWGMAFLPNGDLLVAEKKGVLSRFSNGKKYVIKNVPLVRDRGQGGLLDIKLHPNFKKNNWIYIAFSYFEKKAPNKSNTAIIRAVLDNDVLTAIKYIYKGNPLTSKAHHYGSRMVFDDDNKLYFSNGDRGSRDVFPQRLDNSNGKIHCLNDDGTIPKDNPFANKPPVVASIYSYGHRNPQGLAFNPVTKELWIHEHGPKGGDEINVIEKGKNYGWPIISYGINYSGTTFTKITEKKGMEQPIYYYVPSIAPCGMTFLSSDKYPEWKNNLFIGSLKDKYLERLVINGNIVIQQEKLLEELNSRVRNVIVSPKGYLYVAVEDPGRILKIVLK